MEPIPIFQNLREWKTYSPGLTRIKDVLGHMGMPHRNYPHLVIGGTNGKGTVCSTVAAHLPGKKGLLLSPHLVDIRERITIDGAWVPDSDWLRAYDTIKKKVPDANLSYFEWLVVLAVQIFSDLKVDWAVFEIGLGGRLDAVNTLEPALTAITNVNLDHLEILGSTRQEIAMEKIEIARPGKPMVVPEDVLALPGVAERLKDIGCIQYTVRPNQDYQSNLDVVQKIGAILGLSGISNLVAVSGRRQRLNIGAGILVDGAHNESAWHNLVSDISKDKQKVNILCSLSMGKNPYVFQRIMAPVAHNIYLWRTGFEKELPQENWPSDIEVIETKDLDNIIRDPLVVCGSLYLVGAFLKWVNEKKES